jgi:MinD-like ATPase involved in chromosome partitioning or flagellar assembly
MLKSIDFIKQLEVCLSRLKKLDLISDFFIKLSINQQVQTYVASDTVTSLDSLIELLLNHKPEDATSELVEICKNNKSIDFEFCTILESKSEFDYLFSDNKTDLGLKRSLGALLDPPISSNCEKKYNLVTFFSYKGGVGRTTALALTASYLARQGKNVFVIDCDFEAPGLINFFNTSQSDIQKPGVVEYLNDILFEHDIPIDNYVHNVEKAYSGAGTINLMSAGNILADSENLSYFLEGLARIDLQSSRLIETLNNLITNIQENYKPDVILVDSRTGFNNTFGALVKLSNMVVALAGDDIQNLPGTEYITNLLSDSNINSCFILSILSGSFTRRFNNFKNHIQGISNSEIEMFYFDRQNTLELIGTPLEDLDDLNDFINAKSGSTQYHKFFEFIHNNLFFELETDYDNPEIETIKTITPIEVQLNEKLDESKKENIKVQDTILEKLEQNLPDLYAENINYTTKYLDDYFYIRPCMEDFFIPEKTLLLGDKGTGKTAFYKALQIEATFDLLVEKSQKKHLKYRVLNVTNFESDNFELIGLNDEFIKNELYIKKFWIFYIWNAIAVKESFTTELTRYLVNYDKTSVIDDITKIITNDQAFDSIESDLSKFNEELRKRDERLIITFDMLDNIVKPYLWNDIVSPLIKLSMKFSWENIFPKLFLRRDLYDRLGNLTNKNSFKSRVIDLEWSRNEIYSYFLKVIFTFSGDSFDSFLQSRLNHSLVNEIRRKTRKIGARNQLPLDTHLIQPIINAFFGDPKRKKNGKVSSAYEDLYRNIQSADSTVNLRPFLDLLKYAIEEQNSQEKEKKFRRESVLGLAYCTSRSVRTKAVVQYLEDLWGEQGNELVKYFCEDFSTNKIKSTFKQSRLDEKLFENLLSDIKERHSSEPVVASSSISEFKQVLIANKIITLYLVGNKNRYGFAYLYTNFFGV